MSHASPTPERPDQIRADLAEKFQRDADMETMRAEQAAERGDHEAAARHTARVGLLLAVADHARGDQLVYARSLRDAVNAVLVHDICEAVLLFHDSGPWDDAKSERWQELTGFDTATSELLCDWLRAIRDITVPR